MRMSSIVIAFLLLAIAAPVFAFAATSGPSPIPPPPSFQVSTNVTTLCKGTVNIVPIAIKTPVGAAEMQQLQLSLTNTRSAYTVGNGTVSAINVSPNVTAIDKMQIFVALNTSSIVSAGIAVNYEYSTLYSDSEVRNISFGIETCPTPLLVSIKPGVLTSGKIENITLSLSNTGNTTLNHISMHAGMPNVDGTFLGIQPIQVSAIVPRSTVNITQSVFVYSNATQSFPINLSISLYNGLTIEQIADNPIVLSSGIINITPSSTTLSPQVPTPGSIFSISFVLTDIGTTGASGVTATPLPPLGITDYGQNSTFVGGMQVDTQTPVTLTLTSQSSLKPGNYIIPVRINYLNNLRQNLSTTIRVPVTFAGSSASTFNALSAGATRYATAREGSGLLTIILALGLIVFIVLYLIERGKHKKLKEEHKRLKDISTKNLKTIK